jgi:predicted translin family RNA/ssDNA-binding protein
LKLSRANEGEYLQKSIAAKENEIDELKSDFTSYKKRAAAALSKNNSDAFEQRLKEMEDLLHKVNAELRDKSVQVYLFDF